MFSVQWKEHMNTKNQKSVQLHAIGYTTQSAHFIWGVEVSFGQFKLTQ